MSQSWSPEFTKKDYETLTNDRIYSGYCSLNKLKFRFRLFEGGWSPTVQRECILRDPAAAVLLYEITEDKVVLIEQIRVGAIENSTLDSPWLLEIVAGVKDQGETFEESARRETEEEAGMAVESLLPICSYLPSPGISNELTQVFCGLVKGPLFSGISGIHHEGENIKVQVLTSEQAFSLLKQGKIISASAIIALQWLEINRERLRASQYI
jgi:ADP-ribose diphosphatase